MPGPRDEPRKRRRWIFIAYDRRERSSPRWKFASEPIRLSGVRLHFSSSARYLWKVARHNSCALLDGDDPVDRHIRQSIHMPARPSDFQRLDLGALPTNQNEYRSSLSPHIAHAALGLFDVRDPFLRLASAKSRSPGDWILSRSTGLPASDWRSRHRCAEAPENRRDY